MQINIKYKYSKEIVDWNQIIHHVVGMPVSMLWISKVSWASLFTLLMKKAFCLALC